MNYEIYIFYIYFRNMSSTGLIDFNANYIISDIIDVNKKLTVNDIDIFDLNQ